MPDTKQPIRSSSAMLSPRTIAAAIGVSESSLKRWIDEGRLASERTAGGHRRIAVAEVLRFVRQAKLSVVRPELLAVEFPPAGGRIESADGAAEWLYEALLGDNPAEARGIGRTLFLEGASLGWIFDVPVRSALSRVGSLWEHDSNGVFVEHRATETCLQMVADLAPLIPRAPEGAPVALGGALEGDPYRLPSAMAALVLADAGYEVRNLGPDTPVAATVAAIRHHRPRIVWQSLSVRPRNHRSASRGLEEIADALEGGALIVGGRCSGLVELPKLPQMHRLESMSDLAAFARGFASPAGS